MVIGKEKKNGASNDDIHDDDDDDEFTNGYNNDILLQREEQPPAAPRPLPPLPPPPAAPRPLPARPPPPADERGVIAQVQRLGARQQQKGSRQQQKGSPGVSERSLDNGTARCRTRAGVLDVLSNVVVEYSADVDDYVYALFQALLLPYVKLGMSQGEKKHYVHGVGSRFFDLLKERYLDPLQSEVIAAVFEPVWELGIPFRWKLLRQKLMDYAVTELTRFAAYLNEDGSARLRQVFETPPEFGELPDNEIGHTLSNLVDELVKVCPKSMYDIITDLSPQKAFGFLGIGELVHCDDKRELFAVAELASRADVVRLCNAVGVICSVPRRRCTLAITVENVYIDCTALALARRYKEKWSQLKKRRGLCNVLTVKVFFKMAVLRGLGGHVDQMIRSLVGLSKILDSEWKPLSKFLPPCVRRALRARGVAVTSWESAHAQAARAEDKYNKMITAKQWMAILDNQCTNKFGQVGATLTLEVPTKLIAHHRFGINKRKLQNNPWQGYVEITSEDNVEAQLKKRFRKLVERAAKITTARVQKVEKDGLFVYVGTGDQRVRFLAHLDGCDRPWYYVSVGDIGLPIGTQYVQFDITVRDCTTSKLVPVQLEAFLGDIVKALGYNLWNFESAFGRGECTGRVKRLYFAFVFQTAPRLANMAGLHKRQRQSDGNGGVVKVPRKGSEKYTSRYRGVSWDQLSKKWRAFAQYKKKKTYLGRFAVEKDAARAIAEFERLAQTYEGKELARRYKAWRDRINPTKVPTSRFRGVSWDQQSKKWRAQAQYKNKQTYLGNFAVEKDAARAVVKFEQLAETYTGDKLVRRYKAWRDKNTK